MCLQPHLEHFLVVPHQADGRAGVWVEAQVAAADDALAARRRRLQLLLQPGQLRGRYAAAKLDEPVRRGRGSGERVLGAGHHRTDNAVQCCAAMGAPHAAHATEVWPWLLIVLCILTSAAHATSQAYQHPFPPALQPRQPLAAVLVLVGVVCLQQGAGLLVKRVACSSWAAHVRQQVMRSTTASVGGLQCPAIWPPNVASWWATVKPQM